MINKVINNDKPPALSDVNLSAETILGLNQIPPYRYDRNYLKQTPPDLRTKFSRIIDESEQSSASWHKVTLKDISVLDRTRTEVASYSDSELRSRAKNSLDLIVLLSEPNAQSAKIVRALKNYDMSTDANDIEVLRAMVVQGRIFALGCLATHFSSGENSSLVALSKGIDIYERRRDIQPAFAAMVHEESKHGRMFDKYLEKLELPLSVSSSMLSSFAGMRLASSASSRVGAFGGFVIEVVGHAFFSYFARNSPEPLLKEVCGLVNGDEQRHIDTFQATIELLHRESWFRNPKNDGLSRREKAVYSGMMLVVEQEMYGHHLSPKSYMSLSLKDLGMNPDTVFSYLAYMLNDAFESIRYDWKPGRLARRYIDKSPENLRGINLAAAGG